MLASSLKAIKEYDYFTPQFLTAYDFLNRKDLAALPAGIITLDNKVIVQVQHYSTQPVETIRFETHNKFFDIHYIVSGCEYFGIVAREGLIFDEEASHGVPPENDILYYKEPEKSSLFLLNPGNLIIVSPDEAHKPRGSVGGILEVVKIVVKVPV
jgi:YhcH/YjgK/YiaL family protein